VVNAAEAETVRLIFRRFVAVGSMTVLMRELQELGCRSKSWTSTTGKVYEGRPFNLDPAVDRGRQGVIYWKDWVNLPVMESPNG
jgi:hypothetical protein